MPFNSTKVKIYQIFLRPNVSLSNEIFDYLFPLVCIRRDQNISRTTFFATAAPILTRSPSHEGSSFHYVEVFIPNTDVPFVTLPDRVSVAPGEQLLITSTGLVK